MEIKTITKYQCPICKEEYLNQKDAQECFDKGIEKEVVNVGDIVQIVAGYRWYDGDKHWVINPKIKLKGIKSHGNCFGECCTYSFYYVISKIDQDPDDLHRWRYHVYTKAMTGERGHRDGYTFVETHYTPKLIKNPPQFIIKDSKNLIGKKSKCLL